MKLETNFPLGCKYLEKCPDVNKILSFIPVVNLIKDLNHYKELLDQVGEICTSVSPHSCSTYQKLEREK